ncbi:methyltransferase family protein [Jannaschia sp. CCS1]|uniref:methyltransferase family protein n=1 Tax=Jannaschia sp. (strain CCS1) TaxID=290400 RepID=UPI000053B662|nr:isoprenylcysteine carboxylmethyltransferase family protein [Jannaschia sp. CCS1]ABD55562.1 isoprenylcysteine carboxyl methyltransferase family protein [Jannaschia sp. CCS1]
MKGFPDLPPLWLLAFMGLAGAISRYGPTLEIRFGPLHLLGQVVSVAGFGLILWSALWFWRKKTTIEPHHAPGTLIQEGPYRISRNPIYLGMVMIPTGQVLWLGAILAVVAIPGLVFVLQSRFVIPEEAALEEAFGDEARTYLATTRRWI